MSSKRSSFETSMPDSNINVNDKYTFLKKIGQGNYGEVWLVTPKNSSSSKSHPKLYVLKRLDLRPSGNNPSQNDIESAEREAKLLSTLKHPNIVAYNESFRSNDGFLNIVMAYCEGGDLYSKIKEKKAKKELLTEDQIIEWFIQICMALQYIHDKNILHRDLKTQNIFLTKSDIIKVGDLGIARALESSNEFATTMIGTPYYMSPEIFSQKPYGQKSDIWSLGCCIYEMTTLQHAFNAKDIGSLVIKIIGGQAPPMSKNYSKQLTDIIKSMLKKDPEDRPTAKDILQNSYIKEHIQRLLSKTQVKCHNQVVHSKTQPKPSTSRDSSPPRPNSSSKTSPSRFEIPTDYNDHSVPILASHPPLPPSYSRPPTAPSTNRSVPGTELLPSNEAMHHSESRARRRRSRPNSAPKPNEEKEKQFNYLAVVSQNDTLQRFKRDQQLNNHMKQNQAPSSTDERDASPIRPYNGNAYQQITLFDSSQKERRANSAELESNSSRPSSSQGRATRSYDLNQRSPASSARQRRREYKMQSSSTEFSTSFDSPSQTTTSINNSSRTTSQENLMEDFERKNEEEIDINDFANMLTSTLQYPSPARRHSNRLAYSTDDTDTRITETGSLSGKYGTSGDQSKSNSLNKTSRFRQRYQELRESCLRELSPDQLERVLKMTQSDSEPQMKREMIDEIGEDLFNKYCTQIFSLKFYEEQLFMH